MGGRILNIDPILTTNEKHLILAYNTSLQVYSAAESLLIRKIPLPLSTKSGSRGQIVSLRASATSRNLVWVASSTGYIWLIDWETGEGTETHIKLECEFLSDMSVGAMKIGGSTRDVLYASVQRNQSWHILAYDIQDLEVKASKILFTSSSAIGNLQSVRPSHTLVASAERDIILGISRSETVSTFDDLDYEVFTLDNSDDITCLDVRITDRIHLHRRSQRETGNMPVVEIVVGCARGSVLLYNDILPQLRLKNTAKTHQFSLQPRKYHWHRRAVHAVKWSRDGNYIISGGSESTLVLWQLDTQKMDFLPHLSAVIENIVVSARGAAYVLHLSDNSAMILSTTEMKPTTYVSGIQTVVTPRPFSKDDIVRRVGRYTNAHLSKTPAAVNPCDPSRILLCVGNEQQSGHSGTGPSTPLIQTVDLTTMQSLAKQALTRTNPTDVNTTSKGYAITEPRITGIAYSHDGRWLATVDEWQPPSRDVNALEGSAVERREVYLKFWSVSEESQSLELVSRIDAPHYAGQSESVLDIAADPNRERFATIGEDGIVRLWRPTVRQRDGIVVKGKKGEQLYSWTCSQAIYLHGNEAIGDLDTTTTPIRGSGAICFSEDGSTLVCAEVHEQGSAIHLIDPTSGEIRSSFNGLIKGDIQGIGILSSYLIVLSDTLVVYDMVLDELRYGAQLRTNEETHGPGASIIAHLAVDYQTSRFAVAISRNKPEEPESQSELAVFTTDQCVPELVHKFPCPITSLLPAIGSSGFIVLDSTAQLWSVSEGMDTKSLAFAQPLADLNLDLEPTAKDPVANATVALIDDGDGEPASGDEMDVDTTEDGTDEDYVHPAVVAPQRLTELFNTAPSFAMPPIEDMFYQVTKLFSTKQAIPAA
ncbi:WD domain-containing protein [Biscogniauxia mediterranea]|nr:WD domain-containing protein [Biscogniauxia mediterranea]